MHFKRRLHSIIYMLLSSSTAGGNYIRKHKLFGEVGKDVRLPSGHIPLRSEYIHLHNNIEIAAGAKLIPHDAIHSVFSRMDKGTYPEHIGKIEIFDNVFYWCKCNNSRPMQDWSECCSRCWFSSYKGYSTR